MISPEDIGSVERFADAKALWPDVVDLGKVQRGGNPGFWREKFPGKDPLALMSKWTDIGDWTEFWLAVCPDGDFSFYSKNAVEDNMDKPGDGEWNESTFTDAGECAVKVFRCLVEGRIETENPVYALETERGIILFWPLIRTASGEIRRSGSAQ